MQSAITALRNHPYLFLLTPHSLHHRALAAWHHLPNLSPPLSAASSLHSPPPNSDKPDTPTPPPPSIPFSYPGVDQKAEPTTPSPAAAHPPVYTNHRSRSLSDPAGKPPRPCPHQHQGRDPAPLLSVGDSGSRRLVAGCLNGWGSRALLMGSCCRGSAVRRREWRRGRGTSSLQGSCTTGK